ncbi:MAG: enoyl-CoA hydratase-related protein, partial [Pseudomonadales bacterium]
AQCALDDAGIGATDIDVIATVRTVADSIPIMPSPFGTSSNPPRSVATRISANPSLAIHSASGGQTPQALVNEFAERLADRECELVLLCGAEATANSKAAQRAGIALDWREDPEGEIEDRGLGLDGMVGIKEITHGLMMPTTQYAIAENARRANLGLAPDTYAMRMGQLLAPFSAVASANEFAMFRQTLDAKQIAMVDEKNGYVDYPYTRHMVAKDSVNQGAAVLMTTVGKARELGIAEDKWIYLHAYSESKELPLLERENLGASKALKLAYQQALQQGGLDARQIEFFDIYSCFPIVVELAREALGLQDSDVSLTQTGGLAFFGGPGNNYAMHSITHVVRALRKRPAAFGLVGANGGMISKHAVGIYSAQPGWQRCSSRAIQREALRQDAPPLCNSPDGEAIIETYTVSFYKGTPAHGIVIGRLAHNGERFIAANLPGDSETLPALLADDALGKRIHVVARGQGNAFAFDAAHLHAQLPAPSLRLRDQYEYCEVRVDGHVLEITIAREESYNALHPQANEELAEIFDIYMADAQLRVAIITGSGDKAFCSGNDLKYSASGGPMWFPKTGFAGLTARVGRNKPVIAAVNGVAMGGGMEIVLAADIAVACEHAEFALPEVKRGLIAAAGGIVRLARQITHKQAMELLLTGRSINAMRALELGIVNQVVARGEALQAARAYAAEIANNSPTSVRLTLDMLNEKAGEGDLNKAAGGAKVLDALITSEDFYEGPKAFAEKRKPQWRGR